MFEILFFNLSTLIFCEDYIETNKVCSLEQITEALIKIRGQYKRNI